jgi:hypothetical protein
VNVEYSTHFNPSRPFIYLRNKKWQIFWITILQQPFNGIVSRKFDMLLLVSLDS